MLENPSLFEPIVDAWATVVAGSAAAKLEERSLNEYVSRMRLPSTCGGWVETIAVEELLDRVVQVW